MYFSTGGLLGDESLSCSDGCCFLVSTERPTLLKSEKNNGHIPRSVLVHSCEDLSGLVADGQLRETLLDVQPRGHTVSCNRRLQIQKLFRTEGKGESQQEKDESSEKSRYDDVWNRRVQGVSGCD